MSYLSRFLLYSMFTLLVFLSGKNLDMKNNILYAFDAMLINHPLGLGVKPHLMIHSLFAFPGQVYRR